MEPLVGHCRADSGEHPDRGAVLGGDGSRPGSRRADHADPRRPIAGRLKPRGQSRSTRRADGPVRVHHDVRAVGAEGPGAQRCACGAGGFRLRRHLRPLLPLAGGAGALAVRLGRPRCRRSGHRLDPADDLRHLPDTALPPRGGRAEGGHRRALSDGRFALGLGAGENLNEHVVGQGWPAADIRHEMLAEAVEIIHELWGGGYVNFRGEHFDVESARLYDLPPTPPPMAIAVSGRQSCELAGKSRYGQLAVCYGPDEKAARTKARDLWRWSAAAWKVMAELPGPSAFDAYSRFVREDDIAELVPCGPDVDVHVQAARAFLDAGFTHLALVQVGKAGVEE